MNGPKKMGRPTRDPKPFQIQAKIDEDSMQILNDFCKENGVTRSDAVRMAIARLLDGPKNEQE